MRFITALSARLTCPKPNARPIRHNGQVPDRNGKIFYISITSLSHISKRERIEADRKSSEEDREKAGLLMELENSPNFASTHSVIRKLRKIDDWTPEEREVLLQTAEKNSQVYSVLQDPDIREFYRGILGKIHPLTEEARKIKEIIENRKS